MKSTITAFVFIALVLAACGSNVAKQNVANTVTLPTHPIATPTRPVPPLQSYYLYASDTTLIFLNFADGKDERASTTSQDNVYGQPCLMTYEDGMMSYNQTGNRVTIQALYVSRTPFTMNPDGTLTTNEVDSGSGKIVVENFKPSSIQEYNAQLAQLGRNISHC